MTAAHSPDASRSDSRAHVADWQGVGDAIELAVDRVSAPVEGMHRTILERWTNWAGLRAAPVAEALDGMTTSIYGTVRFGATALGAAISIGADAVSDHVDVRPVWSRSKAGYVQSALNGVWGDRLEADGSPLSIDMGLWGVEGTPISPNPESLTVAFPNPSGRLAVMLHGLGHTEQCWIAEDPGTLVDELEADGFTVVLVRYNTGRSIADNGRDLAVLLEAIRTEWPVPVDELALIGHSMGGLVARNAVVSGDEAGHRWVESTSHLVAIATPHLGSPIEKGVHVLSQGLGIFETTRPLADFVDGRSAGIKDLRHGVDEVVDVVQCHVVAGSVTEEPTHPFGHLVGDLVVRVNSALGKGREREIPSHNELVVGAINHATVLHDPGTISSVRAWLTPVP